jgi:hypothetical protein
MSVIWDWPRRMKTKRQCLLVGTDPFEALFKEGIFLSIPAFTPAVVKHPER